MSEPGGGIVGAALVVIIVAIPVVTLALRLGEPWEAIVLFGVLVLVIFGGIRLVYGRGPRRRGRKL